MVKYLESSCSNFEIDSLVNREPVGPARTGMTWQYQDFCATTRARVF